MSQRAAQPTYQTPSPPRDEPTIQAQAPRRDEPSIGEMVSSLARDTQHLVRQEVALARTEINQSVHQLIGSVITMAAAAFILYAGLLVLLFAAVEAVRRLDLSWLVSSLIVGGVTAFIGLILVALAGAGLKKTSLAPKETMETLREDRDWAKGQLR